MLFPWSPLAPRVSCSQPHALPWRCVTVHLMTEQTLVLFLGAWLVEGMREGMGSREEEGAGSLRGGRKPGWNELLKSPGHVTPGIDVRHKSVNLVPSFNKVTSHLCEMASIVSVGLRILLTFSIPASPYVVRVLVLQGETV